MTRTLDPHQIVSVEWLLANPRCGLADEMRVGKTAPTVVATERAGAQRILVLCPAHVRAVWREAIRDWYEGAGEWQVWSYDQFASQANDRRDAIIAWKPDTVILDECHYLKSAKAKRTTRVYGQNAAGSDLIDNAERIWLLSGTPCPNGPHELWTHMHAVFNEPLSYYDWIRRYCEFRMHPTYGIQVTGTRKIALPDLKAKFRRHFLRRTFNSVHGSGKDPLIWNVVPMPVDRLPREARDFTRSHESLLWSLQEGGDVADCKEPLATLRRLTVDLKADLTVQHVREYLEDPAAAVIVFGYHRDALTRIAASFEGGAVLLLGGTNDAVKEEAKRKFQSGEARVFVGQIETCGSGIDLSRATAVVFAETDWTPGDNVQAAMRSQHRGKQHPVPVDVLVLEGSIDEAVERVKLRKYRAIDAVHGG